MGVNFWNDFDAHLQNTMELFPIMVVDNEGRLLFTITCHANLLFFDGAGAGRCSLVLSIINII
jgi:hypothetical protein